MGQADVEAFVAQLEDVQSTVSFGYTFYFVGDDHRLPFVTIAASDNEYDRVSQLDREGVFAINIGVSRTTFDGLFTGVGGASPDYAALNVVMPHPDYAKQHFVRILNPSGDNADVTKHLIVEAHSIAATRLRRRRAGDEQ
jgi:hypothetical protein